MSPSQHLREIAIEKANDIKGRTSALKRELAQIEERKAAIEIQLKEASLASDRSRNFTPEIGGDLQCPYCWVATETESRLRPIGGGSSYEDFFRCDNGHDFAFPTGLR
jgi:hypothetical protein